MVAPAETPSTIIEKLNAAINAGLKTPLARQDLAKFSAIADRGTPDDFKRFLESQAAKWGSIVKLAGARINIKVRLPLSGGGTGASDPRAPWDPQRRRAAGFASGHGLLPIQARDQTRGIDAGNGRKIAFGQAEPPQIVDLME